MFARIALTLSTVLLTFATICLWSATTHASEMRCERRAMVQGVVGEMVTTCEPAMSPIKATSGARKAAAVSRKVSAAKPSAPSRQAPVSSGAARQGRTTVVARLGARAPSALRIAALDVDGTCGGLPAVCCDPNKGSRAVCGVSTF